MATEFETSRIERAKRGLYGTDHAGGMLRDEGLSPNQLDIANDWGDTEIVTERGVRKSVWGVKFLKTLIIVAILTAFGSAGYLLYEFFDPFSKPSDKNIQVSFDLPVGISPGTPADIVVRVSNQNRTGIEYANLTIVYPSGTKSPDDSSRALRDERKLLGEIPAGRSVEFHTRAIFLGEENIDREIRSTLEYRFERMTSVFSKSVTQPVRLVAAPVTLTIDALKQVNSGQMMQLGITAASNTVIPLRDVLVKVEYPPDFNFTDATPKPTFGNNIWRIGTMNPADRFPISIRGVLSGVDSQEKVFHVTTGAGSDQTERDVSAVYAKTLASILIKEPFIGVALMFDGKSAEEAVSRFGKSVQGTIDWKNNLSTRITNAQIELRLSGASLDRKSITTSNGGFYRSSDDVIIWEQRGNPILSDIAVGQRGSVGFNFTPLASVNQGQLFVNPVIKAEVTIRGLRLSEAGVPEEVKTIETKTVRISTETQFASMATHYSGAFVNTGPIPPRVDQETTYTVTWTIRNTSNLVTNAEARATLPLYVTWTGSVHPSNADVTYSPITHEVIWRPGDIPAGTGLDASPRKVEFQLTITPSLSQVKTSPAILSNIRFSGTDAFTGETVSQQAEILTTALPFDPRIPKEGGLIVP